jgi:hypothetical protein
MARPKSPEGGGKDVVISARFTAGEAAEIDAARGAAERSPWLRATALAAARGTLDAPAARPAGAGKLCPPHPRPRVHKNLCGRCGHAVLPGEKVV